MDEIQRLLRVTARRNSAGEYTSIKFRLHRSLNDRFRERLAEDRVTPNALLEAFLRGYVDRHPAVLAMLDQWIREEHPEAQSRPGPRMTPRDLEEIYAAADCGTVEADDAG